MKLNDKHEAADLIYWHILDTLPDDVRKLCVKPNYEKGGTVNTETGTDLLFGIEDILAEYCEELQLQGGNDE
jgi:hypothetical protein|tara:strand:+ start:821 stop:1036 length:216 start_codon:yes stop_codon:yes gene_type:complete